MERPEPILAVLEGGRFHAQTRTIPMPWGELYVVDPDPDVDGAADRYERAAPYTETLSGATHYLYVARERSHP